VKRREIITLLGSVVASWPFAAGAETNRLRRIRVLLNGPENDTETRAEVFALQKGLRELGWMERRNVPFRISLADGDPERTGVTPRNWSVSHPM
jgi:hypothetical protein